MMPSAPGRPRFQADANFNEDIVRGLIRRFPMLDVQTAKAAGLRGVPDPEVLARAADAGRILLSHDYHTMPGHLGAFLAAGHTVQG